MRPRGPLPATSVRSTPAARARERIDGEVCDGCMSCMRVCPTEAIRIRGGKAIILDALCVDCGICFAACDRHAIEYTAGPVEFDDDFEYRIAVPSSVLYAQFSAEIHIHAIQLALKALGFYEVADLGVPTDQLSRFLVAYIDQNRDRLPLISSHCPTVIRLIQVKFPDLVDRIENLIEWYYGLPMALVLVVVALMFVRTGFGYRARTGP